METTSVESRIILAIQALKNDPELSLRKAAMIYKAPRTALRRRVKGKHSQVDTTVKSRKLSTLEEKTIVQRLLQLDSQEFLYDLVVLKIWQMYFDANATRHLLEKIGQKTLFVDNQRLRHIKRVSTIIRERYVKIHERFKIGLGL
jgi:hypothetical protein